MNADNNPEYTPRKPPETTKPACDCKRVLIVSILLYGYNV